MDEAQLIAEGHYATFAKAGARTEMPGCSLCMGNQARVAPGCTVVSVFGAGPVAPGVYFDRHVCGSGVVPCFWFAAQFPCYGLS